METIKEMQSALSAIRAEMDDRGCEGRQVNIEFDPGNRIRVFVYPGEDLGVSFYGDEPEEPLTKALDYIKSLPDAKTLVHEGYLKKVSAAIDYGHEHSIDDKYVDPLRNVNKAMTDNLLTKEAAQ